MPWEAEASEEVVHAAVRVLPIPLKGTALQPAIELPPSVNLTVPVGPTAVTVAVNVTGTPYVAGFNELEIFVMLLALLITCDSAELLEPILFASPP